MISHHTCITADLRFGVLAQVFSTNLNIFRIMTNLVLLRDMIRNETARGHSDNIDSTFAWAGFDRLFESAIARASIPYSPNDIALCFSIMGVQTIHARSRISPGLLHFTRWYANRISKVLHIELTPVRYRLFTMAPEGVYLLAVSTSPQIHEDNTKTIEAATRPYTFIIRDKARRAHLSMTTPTVRMQRKTATTRPRSPRSLVTISASSCPSAQLTQDTDSCIATYMSVSQERTPLTIEPEFPPPEPEDEYSVYSREQSPARLGAKNTFGEHIKTSVVNLANEFRGTSPLPIGMENSEIPEERHSWFRMRLQRGRSRFPPQMPSYDTSPG